MKMKKLTAVLLSAAMVFSLAACGNGGSGDSGSSGGGDAAADGKKRVCFVARASADTFAAWLTSEMQKAAKGNDDIELTCVSGEADDNKENGLLEDCITKGYDLVIVQSNNNAAQAPYVQKLVEAGIPVITTNPTTHQSEIGRAHV